MSVTELHHHIRLRARFRSHLQWWSLFLHKWTGICMMTSLGRSSYKVSVTSDASGSWGCGAYTSEGQWFQCELLGSRTDVHITTKELLPIVIACALWGSQWQGQTVKCYCDNAAVINSGWSKHGVTMHLMRCLSLFSAQFNVTMRGEHIPGKQNVAADALSRGSLPLFFQQFPTVRRDPTPIPQGLREGLLEKQPDWTSEHWRKLFDGILLWA